MLDSRGFIHVPKHIRMHTNTYELAFCVFEVPLTYKT